MDNVLNKIDQLMYSRCVYTIIGFRCEIPDCDSPDPAARTYQPDWLRFTTPYRDDTGLPKKCERYVSVGNGSRCELDKFADDDDGGNATERCGGPWVFEDAENTVGTEVRNHTRYTLTVIQTGAKTKMVNFSIGRERFVFRIKR